MRILALQPYDATSHRAFLSGWVRNSRHDFEVFTLPGRHFKWRMRQAPIDFAQRIDAAAATALPWDALWCTSMLDLATLRGLSSTVHGLPAVVYFHENQLTYPTRHEKQRDIHFGWSNMTTALAAIASHRRGGRGCVWWNSAYNRDSFLDALDGLIKSMPDEQPENIAERIRQHSAVHYPGIDPVGQSDKPMDGPPVLLWAARWEYDKGPDLFFEALEVLEERNVDFRLSVVGQQFAEQPKCFNEAKERFADRIVRWGYQPDKNDYRQALSEADVVVSTSKHEFFGIAIAEAVSAGCVPVLPDALAYPEAWGEAALYHDQTAESVADAIGRAIALPAGRDVSSSANRFAWSRVASQMDDATEALVSGA